jgi:hypothetical protein
MNNLVPIKVKIGLRENGHADHPQWTKLPRVKSDEAVREFAPFGWMYDKNSGHQEARTENDEWDSPVGQQWGCLLVTRKFADEALAVFPDIITEITEAEFGGFYDTKSRAHIPEFDYDNDALQSLQLEKSLKEGLGQDIIEVDSRIVKAIDPEDETKGIKRNKEKTYAQFKANKGLTIK